MRHPTSRESIRQVMQAIGARIRQPLNGLVRYPAIDEKALSVKVDRFLEAEARGS